MSTEFKLPPVSEAEARIDELFSRASFDSDHPAMQDWVSIKFALKQLTAALTQRDEAREESQRLREALEFYADPYTYHGCMIVFDSPAGGLCEDFDAEHGESNYDRPMPGKMARKALASVPK